MTVLNISFVSASVINIENNFDTPIVVEISKLLTTGIFDTAVVLNLTNFEDQDYDFGDDIGIFMIHESLMSDANTIIIYSKIIDELEKDVKEILLADDLKNVPSNGYDFVTLALLSIMYIGNSVYQNDTYYVYNLTIYTSIAIAIDRCEKYLDAQGNTPQSTNKLWK